MFNRSHDSAMSAIVGHSRPSRKIGQMAEQARAFVQVNMGIPSDGVGAISPRGDGWSVYQKRGFFNSSFRLEYLFDSNIGLGHWRFQHG